MGSMNDEPGFWSGHRWVQRGVAPSTNIYFPASWTRYFTLEELCEMGDMVLADPQGQLPVDSTRLSEAFTNALEMDSTSLLSGSRPENIECRVSSWPVESPRQNVPSESMSMNDSYTTVSWPERNKRKYEVEWDAAPRQVKSPRHEHWNGDLGLGNTLPADRQGQTPLTTGVWNNGAHNIGPHYETTPGRCRSQQELACRAAVAEPGSQASSVAVNGVALRIPLLKLPSENHGATASGSRLKKISNETSRAGPSRYQCDECSQSQGKPVTFSTNKDLQRHLRRTAIHNAPPIARCSCGKTVKRKDAMRSHRKYCGGTTVPL